LETVKKPNYILLGASKSATTTIYDVLRQNLNVFAPQFKEPHFFNIDDNYEKGLSWYLNTYYKNSIDSKVVVDFTPTYLYSKKSAERIFHSLGRDVKFIIILRDPVDRAFSHYLHSKRDGHEKESFESAIKLEQKRLSEYMLDNDFIAELRFSYISQGLYYKMLMTYLKFYDLNDFLIINFDKEISNNMHSALDRVSEFLDIDINSELSDIHSNKSGVSKSKSLNNLILKENVLRKFVKKIIPYNIRQVIKNKIRNFNKEDINYAPLNPDLKSELFDMYFKEDVSNLENLLNQKMDWN
jgi:hypothetical protein